MDIHCVRLCYPYYVDKSIIDVQSISFNCSYSLFTSATLFAFLRLLIQVFLVLISAVLT